jgi:hypothetical protein
MPANGEGHLGRRAVLALWLLLPLAISILSWIFDLALTRNASATDLEGDYYLTALVGLISFITTGPLTAIILGPYARKNAMTLWTFTGLIFLIGLPVLGFQILAYSSSILDAFMVGGPWRDNNLGWMYTQATVIAIGVYLFYSVILYQQAMRGSRAGIVSALLLTIGSFLLVALRVSHM